MLVVQLQEEADTPSPVHGVPGLGPPDQGTMEADREGLLLGAPQGAVGEMAVEVGGY